MKTVLLINEDAQFLHAASQIVARGGLHPLKAEDSASGLTMAEAHLPDVVVSAVTMSGLDGLALLDRLRAQPITASIPVIFLMTSAERPLRRRLMAHGADDALQRPFSAEDLIAAIRARIERSRQFEERLAESLALMQRDVARRVAHELRTPLISIQFAKDLIARQGGQISADDLHIMLDALGEGANRLNHLVEQTVLLTQLDSGALNPENIRSTGMVTPLWPVAAAAIDLARRFAFRNRGCLLDSEVRDAEALVRTNSPALKHALAEILANAINFTTSHVRFTLWSAHDQCWITVADDGPGMPTETLIQLGRDFFQPDRETKEQQGLGLGLAIARRIIVAHDGSLDVQSTVGRGTQVTIKLPAVPLGHSARA